MIIFDKKFHFEQTESQFSKYFYSNIIEEASLNDSQSYYYDNMGLCFNYNQTKDPLQFENCFNQKYNQIILSTAPTQPLIIKQLNQPNNINNDVNKLNNINESKEENKKTKLLGRKRRNDDREVKHTKSKDDNKVIKIKTYLMNFVNDLLNNSLSFKKKNKKFLKLDKKVNETLKKDYNMALMEMTIKEIYLNNKINGRYDGNKKNNNINQILINEIYEKNKEKETIKILNSKYIDLLILLRSKYVDKFYYDILKKETKSFEKEEEAVKYVDELKDLLFHYEEWFRIKWGRGKRNN